MHDIGVWCNGNTTDSGPVILGSSPSTPTKFSRKFLKKNLRFSFFVLVACYIKENVYLCR